MYVSRETLIKECGEIGIELSEKQLSDFEKFAEMVVETNKHLNLTAITDPEGIAVKHFTDSLTLLTAIDIPEGAKVLDVGTGGGFPAVPIMIARRDIDMTMVDSTAKRLKFVDSAVEALFLKGVTVHSRAEELGKNKAYREKFDFVTARAVANLRDLSEYCLPFVKQGGFFIAMKGPLASEEIKDAQNAIKILGGEIKEIKNITLSDAGERNMVMIKKISQTPPKYPRPSAQIAKRPLV